ncbi:MAG: class I SAM-dependent methyltransferase [Flavisolibacter sp.]|nr:class I SAM-dependent methyltransferase [Flavisolibacter sp.]
MFRNRLEKVYRHISRQAHRQGITSYRIYDHDLPEFPFLIEQYEDKLYVAEYKRRHNLSDAEHEAWLEASKEIMVEVTGINLNAIFLKMRKRKEGRQGQYQRLGEEKCEFVVQEAGLKFIVNLSDYLDTGLFLDHRITRSMVRDRAKGKRVLNLFCYTGSFSVYVAAGEAMQVTSVDLSKTYLHWTERNMQLNFPTYKNHETIQGDVQQYIKDIEPERFDIIILDPPTFSNSKRMENFFEIQKDHVALINHCLRALQPGGILFFSTNYRNFTLDTAHINAKEIKDITRQTTPFDFIGKLKRLCFTILK